MERLTNKEATFLILLMTFNVVVLIASQVIVEECSSASLINSIFVSILAIIITSIICVLLKKFDGMDILDISEFLGGKPLKIVVGLIFFVYFLFTAIILLCKLVDCLQIVYYVSTSPIYIFLLFIIATGIICSFKNNAVAKANLIFLPIAVISIVLIFIGNFKSFDFYNVFPILGNGANSVFLSGMSNLFAFSGISLIYFLPSKLKDPSKLTKISIFAIILSAIVLIISVAIVLLMFNNKLVSSQLFPIYLSVRYIEFGNFFQRLDSAFLLFMIIAFVGYLGIATNLCLNIFKNLTSISDHKPLLAPFLLLLFGLALFVRSTFSLKNVQNLVFKILFFAIVIFTGLIILLLATIKRKSKNKKAERRYL